MSVHVYNNYFDGNAKYGVGATTGSSVFVEGNYFRNCKNPMLASLQGTDAKGDGTFSGENGGLIKAYNNTVIGASSLIYQTESATSFDAYLVESRNTTLGSNVTALVGGTTYDNFDQEVDLGVEEANIEDPTSAKDTVQNYAGRVNGGDFKWTFSDSEDSNYAVIKELKSALVSYKSKLISVLNSDGSSTQTGEEAETSSADTVIAMINALPTPSSVTSSDSTAINVANTAYNKLSETEKLRYSYFSPLSLSGI